MQEKAQMSKNRPHIIALGAFLFMLSILVSPLRASAAIVITGGAPDMSSTPTDSWSYQIERFTGYSTAASGYLTTVIFVPDTHVCPTLPWQRPVVAITNGFNDPYWTGVNSIASAFVSSNSDGSCTYSLMNTTQTITAGQTIQVIFPNSGNPYTVMGSLTGNGTAALFNYNAAAFTADSIVSTYAMSLGNDVSSDTVYPPSTCADTTATNFGGALPCKYDTSTRIISVVPANGATVATGTVAFDITGYINPNEYVGASSTTVNIGISNSAQSYNNSVSPYMAISQLGAPYQTWNSKNFQWVATSSGAFSFSTSTDIEQIGTYSMNSNISGPLLHILGWNILSQSLYSTSTSFLVATSTFQDDIIAGASAAAQAVLNSSNQTCDSWLTGSSTFSSLPVRTAVYCFFAPTTLGLSEVFAHIQTSILAVPPLGYVTRAYEIMWSTGTTSLPVAHYVFPDYMPIVGGMEWDVPNWDVLFSTSTNPLLMTDLPLGAQYAGKSPAEVIRPIYDPIIYAIYIYLFIKFVIYKQSS